MELILRRAANGYKNEKRCTMRTEYSSKKNNTSGLRVSRGEQHPGARVTGPCINLNVNERARCETMRSLEFCSHCKNTKKSQIFIH